MSDIVTAASAVIDGPWRYRLTRTWDPHQDTLAWIMLNPSTADATVDDPTIRRVKSFSRAAGYGGCIVVNLYAYRATKPADLWRVDELQRVGPNNDAYLRRECIGRTTVAAWGAHADPIRVGHVLRMLGVSSAPLLCLGVTKHGAPRHPLRVPNATRFVTYPPEVYER